VKKNFIDIIFVAKLEGKRNFNNVIFFPTTCSRLMTSCNNKNQVLFSFFNLLISSISIFPLKQCAVLFMYNLRYIF